MKKLDWNLEQYRTRDRLLEYDFDIYPRFPHSAGLSMIYPWENIALNQLSKQIYQIAKSFGYKKSEEEFWLRFSEGSVIVSNITDFPRIGDENKIYLDKETGILYYFIITTNSIYMDLVKSIGAIISEIDSDSDQKKIFYLYIPIRAMPIENLIINGGEII